MRRIQCILLCVTVSQFAFSTGWKPEAAPLAPVSHSDKDKHTDRVKTKTLKKTHHKLHRSKMSVGQSFVFFLALLSQIKINEGCSSQGFPENSMQRGRESNVGNALHSSLEANHWPACPRPSILQEIGPVGYMKEVLKPSDEIDVEVGLTHKRMAKVPLKYKHLWQYDKDLCQLEALYDEYRHYLAKHRSELTMPSLSYVDIVRSKAHKIYLYEFERASHEMIRVIKLQKERGSFTIGKDYFDSLTALKKNAFISLLTMYSSYEEKIHHYSVLLITHIRVNNDREKAVLAGHIKKLKALGQQFKCIVNKKEYKRMTSECLLYLSKRERHDFSDEIERRFEWVEHDRAPIFTYLKEWVKKGVYCLGFLCMIPFKVVYDNYKIRVNLRKSLDIEKIISFITKKARLESLKELRKEDIRHCEKISSMASQCNITGNYPFGWSQPNMRKVKYKSCSPVKEKKKAFFLAPPSEKEESIIPSQPWAIDIPFDHQNIKPIYRRSMVKSVDTCSKKNIIAYAYVNLEDAKLSSYFSDDEMKALEDIHNDGRYASHSTGSTGYKCFSYKKVKVWEFKLTGKKRLYGLQVPAAKEERKAHIAPLVIFDTILKQKIG